MFGEMGNTFFIPATGNPVSFLSGESEYTGDCPPPGPLFEYGEGEADGIVDEVDKG